MEIYTIGFRKRSASNFFGTLGAAGIQRLVDVRLKHDSQLSGYTRKRDLPYFLSGLVGADYSHELLLAPTPELLAAYRHGAMSWGEYERAFLHLMAERRVTNRLDRDLFALRTVLLCSEPTPTKCHRRLVAELLDGAWGGVEIVHL